VLFGMFSVAVSTAATVGLKATVILQMPPPPTATVSQPSTLIVKSAAFGPLIVAVPGVSTPPPVFLMVTACDEALPMATQPNGTGDGPTRPATGVVPPPAARLAIVSVNH